MLLSLKNNYLFVHIAKTGGTSIRAALARHRRRDPHYLAQFLVSRLSGLYGHRLGIKFPRHARVIAAREMLPRELFDSLFKFAFVRNPWDLQVSSFHHIRRERPRLLHGHDDFASFLKWKLDPQRPYQYHIDISIACQGDYLVDLDGQEIVDFVGRYENLQADFDTVCEKVGLPSTELSHRRRAGDRRDFRDYYTNETADLVAAHFHADIERFGYRY